MTAGTARTGPGPRMRAISGWAGTARPATGWSRSPRCGLMSGSATRCMPIRTRRRSTSPGGRTTRRSGPRWPSAPRWRSGAREAVFAVRAVCADSAYGDQDGFRAELSGAGLPFVMALKPRRGTWAYGDDAHTPVDAARELAWGGPEDPGDWTAVTRTFRDGHAETWWAADARLGWWGPDDIRRLVVVTADPGTLPGKATWYLVTNLPRPGGPREADSPHPAASLAEITRIYGIRHWTEQGYKQVKDELGWADFQVRSDIAIRRHQVLVTCAFSFCWAAWFGDHPGPPHTGAPQPGPAGGERGAASRHSAGAVLAAGAARGPRLAFPLDRAAALVDRMVQGAPATAAASPAELGRGRLRPAPLHPDLTNYR